MPSRISDVVQGFLDSMRDNVDNPEIVPTSLIGIFSSTYKAFTGRDAFPQRVVNSHNNETYEAWMYNDYPNGHSNPRDYLLE